MYNISNKKIESIVFFLEDIEDRVLNNMVLYFLVKIYKIIYIINIWYVRKLFLLIGSIFFLKGYFCDLIEYNF